MISVYQGMVEAIDREKNLTRHGKSTLKIDVDLVLKDIKSLENSISTCRNKISVANMKNIIEYLNKLLSTLDRNNNLKLSFSHNNEILISKPVNMEHFEQYGVRMRDYVILGNGSFVSVEYPYIRDIIAFELMHIDLGYDMDRIENDLGDLGIIYSYPIDRLLSLWEGECEPYKDSLVMAVGDSDYVDTHENVIYDYFQKYKYDKKKYYTVVEESCKRVVTSIIDRLLRRVSIGLKYRICEVTNNGFTLYALDNVNSIIDELSDTICIQCVGRKFEVKPKFLTW